ncbi:MAG: GxxExxY protein [Bacteroidales bacterium]|jgi:GxxExxY protein|nr:GxxExxY protein [Bacteroidales bacterium]MDD2204467.1 GxxExxY protein [Bacteroidales bacterium]MDD3914833.1 GxxExxY protein [Bacteroidales bacterium]MDD4633850.1 GxxExxY protein [Bacteroidales bacterium]
MLYKDITDKIIKAFFNVYNKLGFGFLENVYEKSICIELQKMGLTVYPQSPIRIYYDEELVGLYYADILVEDRVIVELKATDTIIEKHEAQLLNYLKATEIEIGLLLNFGHKAEFKRKIFENRYKNRVIM